MAEVETRNNRATSANDIPNSFTDRSAISERSPGTLPRRFPIRGGSIRGKSAIDRFCQRM
jgi:hypothetical protein